MEDSNYKEIENIINLAYDALDFPPGGSPDWQLFQSVFAEDTVMGLRVFPSDDEISILSLNEYAVAQMEHNLQAEGYSETPGNKSIEVFGNIAVVKQFFSMNYADKPPVKALDVFSLVKKGRKWIIVSVISDMEEKLSS